MFDEVSINKFLKEHYIEDNEDGTYYFKKGIYHTSKRFRIKNKKLYDLRTNKLAIPKYLYIFTQLIRGKGIPTKWSVPFKTSIKSNVQSRQITKGKNCYSLIRGKEIELEKWVQFRVRKSKSKNWVYINELVCYSSFGNHELILDDLENKKGYTHNEERDKIMSKFYLEHGVSIRFIEFYFGLGKCRILRIVNQKRKRLIDIKVEKRIEESDRRINNAIQKT